MRPLKSALFILLLATAGAFASEAGGHEGGDPLLVKKIFNFAILAAGLGFVVVKTLVPALRGQQKSILDDLNKAARRAEEAAAHVAEIDAKMAGLNIEIQALREHAQAEMAAEAARFDADTKLHLAKIQAASAYDLASAVKQARQELKAYSAKLAIDLARDRIAGRMDSETQRRIVSGFASRLSAGPAGQN